ncbi:MAG: hypothetical protein MSIBF_00235 [Candidatus Altiarchaeales archaeon IMC4]|nr:MAG: hypothetical protein MSIBF_00235 [Candidatus Altiarchaeales archaeon IMC4]
MGKIILLAVYGAAVAYLYGAITDLFMWSAFMAEKTLETYIAVFIAGAAFDTMRAAGNVLMILVLGGPTVKVLSRFRKRHLF